MGGLGTVAVAQHDAGDQAFQDSQRPMAQLGIGLERRWQHFAIDAELRSVGIGPPDQTKDVVMGTVGGAPNTTTMPPPTMTSSDKLHGGIFQIGASYYF
jgi:hypothetical protein